MYTREEIKAWSASLTNQPCEICHKEILAPYERCLECQNEIDLKEEAEIEAKFENEIYFDNLCKINQEIKRYV